MIERGVKGVVPGVDIQAEHLTEGHETTKDQEAEKEGGAGMGTKYFHLIFPDVKIL